MKRKSLSGADCPVARSLDVIGDWWSLMIVRDAFDGVRRFGAFQRSLGISKGILAARLKALEDASILAQVSAADGGTHHEYELTAKGRDLFLVIVALRQWGETHCFDVDEPRSVLVERSSGCAIGPLRLDAVAGSPIGPGTTIVRKSEADKRVAGSPIRSDG